MMTFNFIVKLINVACLGDIQLMTYHKQQDLVHQTLAIN